MTTQTCRRSSRSDRKEDVAEEGTKANGLING